LLKAEEKRFNLSNVSEFIREISHCRVAHHIRMAVHGDLIPCFKCRSVVLQQCILLALPAKDWMTQMAGLLSAMQLAAGASTMIIAILVQAVARLLRPQLLLALEEAEQAVSLLLVERLVLFVR
jgi:hypothetical protein